MEESRRSADGERSTILAWLATLVSETRFQEPLEVTILISIFGGLVMPLNLELANQLNEFLTGKLSLPAYREAMMHVRVEQP